MGVVMSRIRVLGLSLLAAVIAAAPTSAGESAPVRAQRDTVGFAVRGEDMEAVVAASLAAEGLAADRTAPPCVAAILCRDARP